MTITMLDRKRWRVLPAVVLVSLITLTGCASTNDSNASETGDSTASSLLPPAEGSTEYPLTLTTWAGESVLEERPERIAVIGFNPNLDALEALGVTPVYALTEDAWSWRDENWVSGIELVDTATRKDPINFEGIASTNPDLIIATNYIVDPADYERLTDIAPVLENEEQIDGDKVDWRDTPAMLGEALDLGSAADEAIAAAEAAIADVAEAHPEFAGKTVTIGNDYGPEWGLSYYTVAGGTAESIMTDLGFAPNPLATEFVDDDVVADENLALLDADVLMMIYGDQAVREARETMPLFQTLRPVTEDRYVSLTASEDDPARLVTADGEEITGAQATWVMRRGQSVLSLPWAVDVIANVLLADVDLS